MNRIVHFEIHADDMERAVAFYHTVFGWTFQKWEGSPVDYRMIDTNGGVKPVGKEQWPGINGGLVKRVGSRPQEGAAVNAYVCTADVESVDASLATILSAGGTLAHPKSPIPGMGWLAYCKDTEGNLFGIMQSDPTAK